MPSRLYMLGICRQVTPYANVMKLGTVGLVGYVIALTAVGPHQLTGFGVSRHQSWVPSIDKAHRAYYTAVPATAGTHDGGQTRTRIMRFHVSSDLVDLKKEFKVIHCMQRCKMCATTKPSEVNYRQECLTSNCSKGKQLIVTLLYYGMKNKIILHQELMKLNTTL